MNESRRLVILDALWEIREVGKYVDEVISEFMEYQHMRDSFIELVILARLEEFSLMFAARQTNNNSRLPYALYRYIHSVPTELISRIDKELYRRERHMRSQLGECNVMNIKIKVRESLLEIEC